MPNIELPNPESVRVLRRGSVARAPFPSGASLSRSIYPAATPSRRGWEVRWGRLTPAELNDLRQIEMDTAGGSGTFRWTPPKEATEIDVRFVESSLRTLFRNRYLYAASVVIEALRPQD